MLEAVKNALQLTTTTKYDTELTGYINAGSDCDGRCDECHH